MPLDLKSHYLIINIPSFTLNAYDADTLRFSMNVVVGKLEDNGFIKQTAAELISYKKEVADLMSGWKL